MNPPLIRILLVEDDEIDRMAVLRRVKRDELPYQIDAADSKEEALALLDKYVYDVALLDYQLVDGHAFDLLPHLRGAPAIVVTGRGDEHVAAEALQRGAYDYLIKDGSREYIEHIPGRIKSVMARRQAEEALVKSEKRYRAVVEDQTELICRFRKDGVLTFVNQAYARYFEKTREEVIGSNIFSAVSPEDAKTMQDVLARLTAERPVSDSKIRFLAPGAQVRWHRWTLRALFDEQGEFIGFQSVGCDIDDQVTAMRRERELQDRLVRSERMESLGLLAGGVAHDLNNLLGPMVAYPDLLLNKFPDGSDEHQIVTEIKRSASRAAAVIRDLLTLARRGRFVPEVLNLSLLIDSYLKSAAYSEVAVASPGVQLETRLDPNLLNVSGSESNLLKVVMNLVINAHEAMPERGQLVIATSHARLEATYLGYESVPAGEYVVLTIKDSGHGITPEDTERIFEPFFTKKKMGRSGSGLGLSVVYGVIKDHHGYIDLKSQMSEGSEFIIYLPAVRDPVSRRKEAPEAALRGSGRILVVDDAVEQRGIAEAILKRLGYEVECVENGRAAVERFQQRKGRNGRAKKPAPYDLVVLDMIMEEDYDGLDTYQDLARICPGTRCILVSGYSETERVKKAQSLGAGKYLAKPYTREELGRAVRESLQPKD